jgi:2'-5' RNA ligase
VLGAESWLRAIDGPPRGVTVLDPQDLHVTLAFLGPERGHRLAAIWEAVERVPAFGQAIRAADLLTVPLPGRPAAIAWRIAEPERVLLVGLMRLWRPVIWDLAGVPEERRPPEPHVTIARSTGRLEDGEALERWCEGLEPPAGAVRLGSPVVFRAARRGSRRYAQWPREGG